MNFVSVIEEKASNAPSLEAFSNLSLYAIKKSVAELLEVIGREGIFREYTRHDISHVNTLLQILGWLVPSNTLAKMTIADCLMTTLAVYLHDLGMAVTRDEFEQRQDSGFPEFKDKVLFQGSQGKDYLHKANLMPPAELDRFLYQEFVRQLHAERIRAWVMGKNPKHLGAGDQVVAELDKLLGGLGDKFRRDLGLVCESHHLDDLDNLDKYKPSQPFGATSEEAANLQYCAVLLRTADLLHVTKDRAPSIAFRTINPSDPKSIEEWHKQMAVIAVRPKPGEDKEGNVDPAAPMSVIEVHGFFTEPEGFFALTAYLGYARKELRKSAEWVSLTRKKKRISYEFPWQDIDDSGLEAQGFIDRQFEFTLDQGRILDLLTGHTLYNETTVVIRELAQNSLDAIRLQWEETIAYIEEAEVRITWSSADRVLVIEDNGTGMTQEIIDRHFLKVGSSRYQDEEFRKQHPAFSAISRFGIGVLSTFMISDEIEVITCHPDDDQARRLSLRSLHGRYLVKLIDKDASEMPKQIYPHGTHIKLKVRSSAELIDLATIAQKWILFPRCRVTVTVDGAAPVTIGFLDPKEALSHELASRGQKIDNKSPAGLSDGAVRVDQRQAEGVTLAYALRWSAYFQEWQFLPEFSRSAAAGGTESSLIGSCVEGVRVEMSTPGYESPGLWAIANSVGPRAPKTNVARSGLETTPERKELLRNVYKLYCDHVTAEVEALHSERNFSLTWALEEASWLLDPLFSTHPVQRRVATDNDELMKAMGDVPGIALEEHGVRMSISPNQLALRPIFWTLDSAFFSSAESILREIPTPVALSILARSLHVPFLLPADDPFISGQGRNSTLQRLAFNGREVEEIVVHRNQRRVDMKWKRTDEHPAWHSILTEDRRLSATLSAMLQDVARAGRGIVIDLSDIYVPCGDIKTTGIEGEVAIVSMTRMFLTPGTRIAGYLDELFNQLRQSPSGTVLFDYAVALSAVLLRGRIGGNAVEFVQRQLSRFDRMTPFGYAERRENPKLIEVVKSTEGTFFDPKAWVRWE